MNIGQAARTQQMLYHIANKNGAFSQTASSKLPTYGGAEDGDNFFSTSAAVQGTVRQIAQRLYDASFSADAEGSVTGGAAQDVSAVDGDMTLRDLRKQLAANIGSVQQGYQPDQTAFSGNFQQLQALAQSKISRLQTVSLSSDTTKAIQKLALNDAKESAGGTADVSASSREDRAGVIQEELQKFAPSKRAAALNTINQVWQNELDRIGAYIKEKDPDWNSWGDKFDSSILDGYKAGVNTWV